MRGMSTRFTRATSYIRISTTWTSRAECSLYVRVNYVVSDYDSPPATSATGTLLTRVVREVPAPSSLPPVTRTPPSRLVTTA